MSRLLQLVFRFFGALAETVRFCGANLCILVSFARMICRFVPYVLPQSVNIGMEWLIAPNWPSAIPFQYLHSLEI
jgi:hypothetical protein